MDTAPLLICLFLAWFVVGAVAMAAIDDDQKRVLAWADRCPFGGAAAVVATWPVWVCYALIARRRI